MYVQLLEKVARISLMLFIAGFSESNYTSNTSVVLERSGEGLNRLIHIIVTLSGMVTS